jgi:hypothetical protein
MHQAPVAEERCIHCKIKRPGGTPWLCLPCTKLLVKELSLFETKRSLGRPYNTEYLNDHFAKKRLNKVQLKARLAWKRYQRGLQPAGPKGKVSRVLD